MPEEGHVKTSEELRRESIEQAKRDSQPVTSELRRLGFEVEFIDELYMRKLAYRSAIPILIKWLPAITNDYVKESIVRALSVPWGKPVAALPLIVEFRKAPAEYVSGLKWAIGNALDVVADDSVFEQVSELALDRQHGKAREMLAFALGKMKNPRAADVLVQLLGDEEMQGHAVAGLRKLRLERTRPHLERFVNHPKAWVRNQAKRALANLDRAK